jgi:CO/xanthine dehydrogenase Mo-binding subunit
LRRCAADADAGKALHATSSKRQVEGGFIMGLGLALFEEMVYDDAGLRSGNGWAYRLARMDDLPAQVVTILVENGDGPGPFGAKGLAQTTLPCVAPAIGNAIRDAIGIAPQSTPFTPRRILPLLSQAGGER